MRRAHAILAALALSLATATPALAGMQASTTRVRLALLADVSNRATERPRPEDETASVPGQFLSRDPAGFADSVNLYAAFANDPVNKRDPTGRQVPTQVPGPTNPPIMSHPSMQTMAALGEVVSQPEVVGTVQLTGAALECVSSGFLWALPEPSSKVAAGIIAGHCIDTWNAGWKTIAQGQVNITYTAEGGQWLCRQAGADEGGQAICGAAADIIVSLGPQAAARRIALRTHPLRSLFRNYPAKQGFSGVYDRSTGAISFAPSSYETPVPRGMVPARGGHATVSANLGGDAANHFGFAVVLQEDGTLSITWLSRTLNRTSDAMVPVEYRRQIIEAVEKLTGIKVAP